MVDWQTESKPSARRENGQFGGLPVKYDGAVVVRLPTAIGGRVLDEKSANARSVAYGRFAQDK